MTQPPVIGIDPNVSAPTLWEPWIEHQGCYQTWRVCSKRVQKLPGVHFFTRIVIS